MRIPDYIKPNNCEMIRCTATFTRTYLVKAADEAFYNFVGKQMGISLQDYIHPDYWEEFEASCEDIKPGERINLVLAIHGKDHICQLCGVNLIYEGRKIQNLDVMELQLYNFSSAEVRVQRFLDHMMKYRTFLALKRGIYFDYDAAEDVFSIYRYQSCKASQLFEASLQEYHDLVISRLEKNSDQIDFEDWCHHMQNARENFTCNVKIPVPTDPDQLRYYQIEGRVIYKQDKNPLIVGIFSRGKDDPEEIPYYLLAEGKDSATGLLNKRACREYAVDVLNENKNEIHYMVIMDVDNFKDVNDNYGHLFGDSVIEKVAEVTYSILNGRGIVGRFGGDEFFILTSMINTQEELRSLLTAIRLEVLDILSEEIPEFQITLSIGVSRFPNNGTTYDELFKIADKCLYIAKSKGKNRFIIYEPEKHGSMETQKEARYVMNPGERAIHHANVMPELSERLFREGTDSIVEVLDQARIYFDVDGVRVYSAKTAELLYLSGQYKRIPCIEGVIQRQELGPMFNGNDFFAAGNVEFLKAHNRELYTETISCDICSMMIYRFTRRDGEEILFFYDIFNHAGRWSDSDRNYLLSLSKSVTMIMK